MVHESIFAVGFALPRNVLLFWRTRVCCQRCNLCALTNRYVLPMHRVRAVQHCSSGEADRAEHPTEPRLDSGQAAAATRTAPLPHQDVRI